MFAVLAIIIVILAAVMRYKWKRRRLVKLMDQFEGPPMKPIFGNTLRPSADIQEYWELLKAVCRDYKSPSRMWFVYEPVVLIYTPEDFQMVVWKTLEKPNFIRFIAEVLGDGIFSSKVEKWRHHRKLLSGSFNPIFLKEYFLEIFNRGSAQLVERLNSEVGTGKQFDLWPYVIQTSINTISQTAVGFEESFPEETIVKFGNAVIKSAEITSKRICQPFFHLPLIFKIYKYLKGFGSVFQLVQDYPLQMIELKKKQMDLNKFKSTQTAAIKDKSLRNFIGILLDAKDKHRVSDQELKDEVTSVMFGGSETNAVTSCFLLLMLAMRQDIQEKVYQELLQVFGDSDRTPDLEDVKKLPFLEQCIKETLRRFPIVPIIFRYANCDIPISNNYLIPQGANILLGIVAIHHDPKIYPDPLTWNPDNFTPEREAVRHKCAFVPFSDGPRGCIGQKYSWALMKIQLSTLLRNFRFHTDMRMEDLDLNVDFIIRSKHGYNVKLESRYRKSRAF